ncbi:restriction endonuclease subunit S [Mycobacterium sp. 1245852.3]|uniref:restriction endonuclease subunit S n=1 Tax=Mycobacterium sp. 1245852.3 TaxID=1856860 RepID=UPI0009ECEA29|nr:restriction endonuclease subunit S [Mycobacterium sp. 1245852.3]
MATVEDLFEVKSGHSLPLNKLQRASSDDGIAFVSRTARNNGVSAWVSDISGLDPAPAGSLTVSLRSRNHALATFVQPRDFYTGYHVAILSPRKKMTLQEKLWWAQCIQANRFRFNFGRQANRTLRSLTLPDKMPNWAKKTAVPVFERAAPYATKRTRLVDMVDMDFVSISELFELHRGRNILKRNQRPGVTPYVSASGLNNGISSWIAVDADWPGNCITIASNGDVGSAFFQPAPFIASADVTVLKPKFKSEPADLLFFCTIVRQEKYRWNYGRKWSTARIRETKVRMPIKKGSVDWHWIRKYMSMSELGPLIFKAP